MHVAKAPPVGPKPFAVCRLQPRGKIVNPCFELSLEQVEDARDGDQHGDAPAADQLQQARRLKAVLKMHFGGQQRRNPQSHELPKDMTQRERVQKTKWMKGPL